MRVRTVVGMATVLVTAGLTTTSWAALDAAGCTTSYTNKTTANAAKNGPHTVPAPAGSVGVNVAPGSPINLANRAVTDSVNYVACMG